MAKLLNACRIPHLSVRWSVSQSVSREGRHDGNASVVSVLPEQCVAGRPALTCHWALCRLETVLHTNSGFKGELRVFYWLKVCDFRQINGRLRQRRVYSLSKKQGFWLSSRHLQSLRRVRMTCVSFYYFKHLKYCISSYNRTCDSEMLHLIHLMIPLHKVKTIYTLNPTPKSAFD